MTTPRPTADIATSAAAAIAAVSGSRSRVVVAMSGGVDSSVAAAMMKAAGHDVIGITLQLYDHGAASARKGACCAGQDIHDARRVADLIGIPHYVLDYEERFRTKVIEQFAESYVAGETPIPCVTCNNEIKFRDLLETAKELGAEQLVTGHYVQRFDTDTGPVLTRAVDPDRDQSYFLFGITPEQLKMLRFPVGGLRKPEVRELARSFNIPIADKADSQDICFVPSGRYTDIIERLKPSALEAGDIVHIDGRTLGRHNGIVNYTVGQRKGLKIPGPEPLYVIRLEAAKNQVIVGPRAALATTGLRLRGTNWLGDEPLSVAAANGLELFVRMRSSQPLRPAVLSVEADGTVYVDLLDGEEGLAMGQACVFYATNSNEARILGGGWIAKTVKAVSPLSPPPAAHDGETQKRVGAGRG
jgi:tRNA-uridine 2-sulfurtransferase